MVEVTKIGNKTLVMDGKILSLFRKGSLLRQMYYGGYEDFDGANGGVWKKYINIPIKTVPLEYAQYLIEIDDTNVSVYNVEGTLKAQSAIASEFWSLVRSDGFDIRAFDHLFNQLWFWVEEFDYTNKKAKIWVRLPENSEELNIAFGNEKAYESWYNNGDEVFEFFDDFEGTELDTTKWEINGNPTIEISNGIAYMTRDSGEDCIYTKQSFDFSAELLITETKARWKGSGYGEGGIMTALDPSTGRHYWHYPSDWDDTIRAEKRSSHTNAVSSAKEAYSYQANVWFTLKAIVNIQASEIKTTIEDENGNYAEVTLSDN